jgi:hypothetical protein
VVFIAGSIPFDQLVSSSLRVIGAVLVIVAGNRIVHWLDERAKHRRKAEYALRFEEFRQYLSQVESEKRKSEAADE